MVLRRILQQVPCRRLRVRCYAVLLVKQVGSDCPELLPKVAVAISEAVAAVDV